MEPISNALLCFLKPIIKYHIELDRELTYGIEIQKNNSSEWVNEKKRVKSFYFLKKTENKKKKNK